MPGTTRDGTMFEGQLLPALERNLSFLAWWSHLMGSLWSTSPSWPTFLHIQPRTFLFLSLFFSNRISQSSYQPQTCHEFIAGLKQPIFLLPPLQGLCEAYADMPGIYTGAQTQNLVHTRQPLVSLPAEDIHRPSHLFLSSLLTDTILIHVSTNRYSCLPGPGTLQPLHQFGLSTLTHPWRLSPRPAQAPFHAQLSLSLLSPSVYL